jgi:hypothetical protein
MVDNIQIEEISSSDAADMTLKIILNEYHAFNQHITWHEYNSILLQQQPIVELDKVLQNWLSIYNDVFSSIKCFNIKIPTNIDHKEFLLTFKERFSNV